MNFYVLKRTLEASVVMQLRYRVVRDRVSAVQGTCFATSCTLHASLLYWPYFSVTHLEVTEADLTLLHCNCQIFLILYHMCLCKMNYMINKTNTFA